MTLTVLEAAHAGSDWVYDPAFPWTKTMNVDGCYVGLQLRPQDRCLLVCPRGTVNLEDGLRDLEAGIPEPEGALGTLPMGFYHGTPDLWPLIYRELPSDWKLVFAAHSLGAAESCDLAGFAIARGIVPFAMVLMGSPMPGGKMLADLLQRVPIWYSFRNGQDPVWDVPTWGVHPRDAITLHEPPLPRPAGADPFDWHYNPILGWHDSARYRDGIAKLNLPPIIA